MRGKKKEKKIKKATKPFREGTKFHLLLTGEGCKGLAALYLSLSRYLFLSQARDAAPEPLFGFLGSWALAEEVAPRSCDYKRREEGGKKKGAREGETAQG